MPHHLRKAEAERVRARASVGTRHGAAPGGLPPEPRRARALDGRIAVPYSLDTPFTNVDLDDVAEVAARWC